ncbi:hypothetical protein [Amycolatopsis sp. MEPSY49]|uniref:hypothetical protein n=1 Tax=Amycolatopsis sp. MEPSY49 TaxID=3151600 RepID=UPI003EFA0096
MTAGGVRVVLVEGRRGTGGSGVKGMVARAGQLAAELSAGPEGLDWVVVVGVPAGGAP